MLGVRQANSCNVTFSYYLLMQSCFYCSFLCSIVCYGLTIHIIFLLAFWRLSMMQLFLFLGHCMLLLTLFFKKLVSIQKSPKKWKHSDELVIQRMTTNIQLKFNKYWDSDEINYLLLVVVFLDPHYKCEYIQFCFNCMYCIEKSKDIIQKFKDLIHKLIQQYVLEHPNSHFSSNSTN